ARAVGARRAMSYNGLRRSCGSFRDARNTRQFPTVPPMGSAMADPLYKRMTAFLLEAGIDDQPHSTKTYLGHLIAVHRFLEEEGCGLDACRAGLFHSVYGTELFQGFKLPLDRRADVRELIGERAERLAYLNCAMDRASFDASVVRTESPYPIRERESGV